jgi:hypothetical protein
MYITAEYNAKGGQTSEQFKEVHLVTILLIPPKSSFGRWPIQRGDHIHRRRKSEALINRT